MDHVKYTPGEYPVKFEGVVIGEATLDEDGKVIQANLSSEGLKKILPDYDSTEGLSIDETVYEDVEKVDVVSAYPEWDVRMATERYFRKMAISNHIDWLVRTKYGKKEKVKEMGIDGMRNLFEDNESERSVEQEEADLNFVKDTPYIILPPLDEGFEYKIVKLPSGSMAVLPSAKMGQVDDLNTPESRTLRHRDS